MSDTTSAPKVKLDPSKYNYQTNKEFRTQSGRSTIDNGDDVASILRGMTTDGVFEVLVANGGKVNPAWEKLNSGMQRMNAGNIIRRIAKGLPEGTKLVIPETALATITKVDAEAKAKVAAEREAAKAAKAQEAEQAKAAREAEKVRKAEEKAAAEAKAAADKEKAEAKAEKERQATEAKAAKEAEKAAKAAAKGAKTAKAA